MLPRREVVAERLEAEASRCPARAGRPMVSHRSKPSSSGAAAGAARHRPTARSGARARRSDRGPRGTRSRGTARPRRRTPSAGTAPHGTDGHGRASGMRPATVSRPVCHSRASRTGMEEALRQGRERVRCASTVTTTRTYRALGTGRQATGPSARGLTRRGRGASRCPRAARRRRAGSTDELVAAAPRRRSTTATRSATPRRSRAASHRSVVRCRAR